VSKISEIRSALFAPAAAPTRYKRALSAGADAVFFDLEDAVAASEKDAARDLLVEFLAGERPADSLALVRVNAPATPTGRADLEAVAKMRIDGVVVPKADPEAVALAAAAGLPLVALVETAAGILEAAEVAAAPAVEVLMLGPVDLAVELGVRESPSGDELIVARGQLVLAAAAAGLPGPLDGPCLRPRDERVLELEIERARRLGFGGKTCIHPAQIGPVAAGFSPNPAEREWARKIAAAFAAAGEGVVEVDGEMVDQPVARRARRILAAE
jgi:citrate lyase subunit beta/citryl-CoA lyase